MCGGAWRCGGDAWLASSFGMRIGCAAWLRELAHRPAFDLPRAVAATACLRR
jgi:hypothetical protein